MLKLADSPKHIIPGHDPLVMQRHPAPSKEMKGIVVRLDADPLYKDMTIFIQSSVSRTVEPPRKRNVSLDYLASRDPGSPVASALNWVPDNAYAFLGNEIANTRTTRTST
jgi:hypothetical protein